LTAGHGLLVPACWSNPAFLFFLLFSMSVYVLPSSAFASISATLRVARDSMGSPAFPLSVEEKLEFHSLVAPILHKDEESFRQELIEPFVCRLYIANVLAEQYTYLRDDQQSLNVPLIEFPAAQPFALRELLSALRSLSYNIVTNGGNSFLGRKDQKKLDRNIAAIQRELVQ
jgi:hypothetical protein